MIHTDNRTNAPARRTVKIGNSRNAPANLASFRPSTPASRRSLLRNWAILFFNAFYNKLTKPRECRPAQVLARSSSFQKIPRPQRKEILTFSRCGFHDTPCLAGR